MNPLSSNLLRVASLALALPIIGLCSNVQINGICVNAINCSTPTAVTYGNTTSGSTANGVSVNGDAYSVTSTFTAGYNSVGTFVTFNPIATYLGMPSTTTSDTLTIDLYASIFDDSPGTWDGKYNENIPFNISKFGTASGDLLVSSSGAPTQQGVGLVGPFGSGTYNVTKSAMLTGLTGNTLNYDYHFVFTFGAGTTTGDVISAAAVPEPMQTIPAALGLIGVGLAAIRRRKK